MEIEILENEDILQYFKCTNEIRIKVESAGYNGGNYAKIFINGN